MHAAPTPTPITRTPGVVRTSQPQSQPQPPHSQLPPQRLSGSLAQTELLNGRSAIKQLIEDYKALEAPTNSAAAEDQDDDDDSN